MPCTLSTLPALGLGNAASCRAAARRMSAILADGAGTGATGAAPGAAPSGGVRGLTPLSKSRRARLGPRSVWAMDWREEEQSEAAGRPAGVSRARKEAMGVEDNG